MIYTFGECVLDTQFHVLSRVDSLSISGPKPLKSWCIS
jgi:hypothetical protein